MENNYGRRNGRLLRGMWAYPRMAGTPAGTRIV